MDCKVCGDKTTCLHYGAICCMSCKIFFRRQVKQQQTVECRFHTNACKVTVTTRRHCPACRLAICYQIGMRKSCVRSAEENAQHRETLENKRRHLIELKYKSAQIDSLDLLRADRSSLNVNQWGLLSNLVHNFDILLNEQRKQLLSLQISNPIKTRFKLSSYEQLVAIYFHTTKPLIERIPDYQELALKNRLIITYRSLPYLVALNAMNSMNLIGNRPYFEKNLQYTYDIYYGDENVFQAERLREKLDLILNSDLTIFKLFFVILIFSNITTDISTSIDHERSHSQILFHLQNRYIELLWRYILFRFRHEHMAIRLFSDIIHLCVRMQKFLYTLGQKMAPSQKVVDILAKNIESTLDL